MLPQWKCFGSTLIQCATQFIIVYSGDSINQCFFPYPVQWVSHYILWGDRDIKLWATHTWSLERLGGERSGIFTALRPLLVISSLWPTEINILFDCLVIKVINRLVIDRYPHEDKPTLTLVPQGNLQEFWLPLTMFDLSITAKNGCSLPCLVECNSLLVFAFERYSHWTLLFLAPDYPQNEQCRAHFGEFLLGYRSSAEAVQCKFPYSDSTRAVKKFCTGFIDGFNKVILMVGILAAIHEMEPQ